jgi:flagellar protein FlaG
MSPLPGTAWQGFSKSGGTVTISSIDSFLPGRADERRPAAAIRQAASSSVGAVGSAGAEQAQADSGASLAQVKSAVGEINKSLEASGQNLEFSLDEDSQKVVVKVIDTTTKEVLRQMPTKEALEIAKSLDKMQGLLIDQEA